MYSGRVTKIQWERVFITIEGQLEKIESEDELYEKFRIRKPGWFDSETGEPKEEQFEEFYAKIEKVAHDVITDYDTNSIYFFLRTDGYLQTYLLKADLKDDLSFSIRMNVTNFQNRAEIPNGTFFVSVLHNGVDYALNVSTDVVADAFENSRSFLFNKDSSCYVVNISSTTNELDPRFELKAFLFSRTRNRKFSLKRAIRENKTKLNRHLIQLYYNIVHKITPKKGKHILFATETRGRLQGNLEAIYNRMLERGLDKEYKIYMSFRRAAGGHSSMLSWIKLITYMACSDIILIDDYAPVLEWLDLKDETKLIQVWHAGVGFKSVGFCRFGCNASPKLSSGHRKYTYAIAGSSSLKKVYSEVFGIEEDSIIPTGLPRIDQLVNKEKNEAFRKSFYQSHPEFEAKKIILFAPTFRGTGQKSAHYPYELIDFDALYEFCGEEYVFMFKMHPFILKEAPIPEEYKDCIVDYTAYPNINELLQIADVLITDYSSVIYEYSLTKKPMIFFAYDKDTYSVIRGFQSNFDEFAPGKICTTFQQVLQSIKDKDFDIDKVEHFVEENFDYLDGNSSDRVIDWLILEDRKIRLQKNTNNK